MIKDVYNTYQLQNMHSPYAPPLSPIGIPLTGPPIYGFCLYIIFVFCSAAICIFPNGGKCSNAVSLFRFLNDEL